jgi:hypothetical protein
MLTQATLLPSPRTTSLHPATLGQLMLGWAPEEAESRTLDGPFEDAEVNLKLPKLAEVSFFKLFQT